MVFTDRQAAGKILVDKLSSYRGTKSIVFGVARGGVVVASVISKALSIPLDVLVVKKITSPGNSELAIGALAPNRAFVIDSDLARRVGVDKEYIDRQIQLFAEVIKQKTVLYRKKRSMRSVIGRTIILIDDGAATGATVDAAVAWFVKKRAGNIIIALPVAPKDVVDTLSTRCHALVVLLTPDDFVSVGQYYKEFPQIHDEEVVQLLAVSHQKS